MPTVSRLSVECGSPLPFFSNGYLPFSSFPYKKPYANPNRIIFSETKLHTLIVTPVKGEAKIEPHKFPR